MPPTPDLPSSPILQEVQSGSSSPVQILPSSVSGSSQHDHPKRATRTEDLPSTSHGTQEISELRTKSPVNIYDDSET